MNIPEAYYTPLEQCDFPEITEGYLPDNVSVHFVFGRHGEAEHFEAAAEYFDACDIFLPEVAGWGSVAENWFRAVSKAAKNSSNLEKLKQRKPFTKQDEGFMDKLSVILAGTYKPVVLIDARPEQLPSQMENVGTITESGDYATTLRRTYEALVTMTAISAQREKIMLENLGPAVSIKIKEHPRLRNKDKISVLASLGAKHYPVYEHLSESEHTKDQVSASMWVLLGQDDPLRHSKWLSDKIRANQELTRQEVVGYYIAAALSKHTGGPVPHTRENQRQFTVYNRLLHLVIKDIDKGSGEMLHRINTGKPQSEDRERLKEYMTEAQLDTSQAWKPPYFKPI